MNLEIFIKELKDLNFNKNTLSLEFEIEGIIRNLPIQEQKSIAYLLPSSVIIAQIEEVEEDFTTAILESMDRDFIAEYFDLYTKSDIELDPDLFLDLIGEDKVCEYFNLKPIEDD